MSINFPPIQESLEEAVSNLNKLGCNLQTRCGNLRKKRLAAEKMRAPDGITKLCEKILVICDLSKKSIDNVEHSVRKAMGTYLDDRRKNFHPIDNQQIRISNDTNRNEDTPRNENSTLSNPKAKNDDAAIDVLESQRDSGLFYDFDNAVRIPNGVNISNYISCVVRIPFFEKNAVDSYKDHTFSTSKKKKKVAFVDKPIVINDHLDVTNTDQGNESSDLFASDDSLDKRVSSSESDTNEPNQSENYRHNKHALEIGKKIKCDEKELKKSLRTGLGDMSLFRTSKEICLEKGVQYEKKNKSDSKKPYRSKSVEESIENNGPLIEKQVGNDNSKSSNSRSSNEIVQSDDDCSTVATKERNENLADSNQNTSNDLKKDFQKNENEGTHLEKQITVGIGNEINISSEVSNTLEDRVNAKLIEDRVIMGVSREQKKSTKEVEVNTAKLIGDNVLHGISNNVETSTKESEVNAKIIEGDIVRTVVIEHKTSTNENNEEKTDGLGIESNKPDISRDNEVVDLDPKKLGEYIRLSPLSEHKTSTNENNEEKTDGLGIESNKPDISRDNEVVDLDPKKLGENIRLSPLSDHEICNKSPIILNIASDDSNLLTPVKTEPKSIIRCINIAKLLASPKQKPPEEVIDLDLIDTPSPAEKNKKKINYSRLNVGKARKQLLKSKPHIDEPSVVSKKPEELALDELHKKIKSDIENNRCVARVRLNRMGSLQSLLLRHNLTKITKYCKTIIKRSVSKVDDSARRSLLHNSTSEDENSQPDKASADDSDSDNSNFLLKPRKLKLKRKDRKSTISDDSCDSDDNEMGRSMRLKSRSADSKNNSDSSGSNQEKSIDAAVDRLTNLKDLGKTEQKKATDNSSDSAHEKAKKVKTNKDDKSPKHVENGLDDEIENDSSNDNIDQRTESPSCNATNGKNEAEELAKCDLLDSNDTDDTDKNAGQKKTTEKESHCLKSSSKSKGKKKPVDKLLSGKLSETESSNSEDPKKSKSDSVKDSTESSDDCNLRSKKRCKTVLKSDSDNDSGSKKNHKSGSQSDDSHKENESDKKSESDNSSDDFKTGKRKKKIRSSDDSDSDITKGKKKRRRIKNSDDSDEKSNDDNSDDDSGDEGAKRGRKNIRRVMRRDDLGEATIRAEKEERLRRQRIADRQKQYNSVMFDESGKPEEAVVEKVVLDFDPETKEPIIEVDKGLVKKLKPHQANGVKFMWDASYESVKQIEKRKGSGCILAHCMGLGKTLQVISLIHTLLSYPEQTKTRRVLVVCPLSTVLNWVNEFKMWLEHADGNDDIAIYELSRYKQNFERAYQLQEWLEEGGVCVLGYEMFRNLSADNTKKYRKKMLKTFQESLVDPGPDLVVCDEGHLLKNEKTSLSQSMNRIKTRRRIVLTGTPLQNNLKEYYCMVQFVKPNLLGKYNEYLNRFVNPITNGQYTNSTEYDIRIMKRRSHVLHKLLDGAVQRRDYAVLAPFLPPKQEYVFFITVTDIQTKLYQYYLDNYSRRPRPDRKNSGFLFPDFQSLQRIWTHPLVLKANSARYELMQQKKRDKEEDEDSEGSLINFIDDDESDTETSAKSTSDNSSNESSNDSDDSTKRSKNKKKKKSGNVSDSSDKKDKKSNSKGARATRSTRANPVSPNPDETIDDIVEVKSDNPTEWWIPLVADVDLENMALSNKLVLLFEILRQCEAIGDKVLVFSQSLYSLDLIEHFLSKIDEATQAGTVTENLCGHIGSWSQGLDYFRLDGQTSCENRSIWCKSFNREDNPRARLFLISTRAGGLGINLVAANRVIIFDVSWNPSHDVQSIFRIYRFGQKKPCYIYRFLAMGTMEEKIYERQVTKQAISKRVIDEQQIDRHYAENDLQELYTFTPVPEESRPVPPLPKDRLFAEMLKKYETLIYKYHEHDSLLENKEEETLTEEERKAAWEDFENEKNKPPPPPPGMMGNMMPNMNFGWNGLAGNSSLMINNVLGRIRSENPNMTAAELNAMIPTIMSGLFPQSNLPQQAFPNYDYSALQNKMASLLNAYPQGRIANPMMAGLGGVNSFGPAGNMTSEQAAAYSSWQYQQLQNLQRMQQQAPGMKYYAGGLGSRDPISMAEAQKRQRDMIISGMSDAIPRRGRPPTLMPKMPLGPPNRPGDVVNLDDSE